MTASGTCPNCTFNTLGWSQRRKTFRCWTCGYEALTDRPVTRELSLEEVEKLLCPKSSGPLTLTGNKRASIWVFIEQLEAQLESVK